jgi:hypothetical protein
MFKPIYLVIASNNKSTKSSRYSTMSTGDTGQEDHFNTNKSIENESDASQISQIN